MNKNKYPDTSIWRKWPLLLLFVVIPLLIEAVLSAADFGLIVSPLLRPFVYEYGAFWAGLLDNWRPNYPSQPWLMFVTYSFLHAGPGHLIGNMVAFVGLMQITSARLRWRSFMVVYLSSAIGGALAFAFIGPVVNPMVGASGALFGLAGAWRFQEWQRQPDKVRVRWLVLRDTVLIAAMNLVMWVLQGGALAWEAHMGGYVTGIAAMALVEQKRAWTRRRRARNKG